MTKWYRLIEGLVMLGWAGLVCAAFDCDLEPYDGDDASSGGGGRGF